MAGKSCCGNDLPAMKCAQREGERRIHRRRQRGGEKASSDRLRKNGRWATRHSPQAALTHSLSHGGSWFVDDGGERTSGLRKLGGGGARDGGRGAVMAAMSGAGLGSARESCIPTDRPTDRTCEERREKSGERLCTC